MKKILITSALPYVNNVPHLGNIIGCVLSADVYSRYCKSQGYNSLYICGTDEYGTATEIKALEEKCTPQEICDKYHNIHKKVYEWFGIEFDTFGRTSTPKHTEITHQIFMKLQENGYLVEEEVEQWYDSTADMFLADRYLSGTCPYCSYDDARGDQCDKCGHLLHANELKNPISKITGTTPSMKKSKHLFIDLKQFEEKLDEWIEKQAKEGFWSENSYTIAKSWLKQGLKRRAITRDLKWGVPVPIKGFENKKFYVWFEAPIGYISITANLTDEWKDWWLNPEEVNLYQFMGKDNVPFHTVIFPATLFGTREPWTMLYHINTTEYLNYEGGKFSKSRGIGVFGTDAINSGIAPDVWRYYLLTNRPEVSDSDFTWEDFRDKNNNELLANLGNLVNRTLVFIKSNFNSRIPEGQISEEDKSFIEGQKAAIREVSEAMEKVKIKEGLHLVMAFLKNTNKYFQDNKPWEAVKDDSERASAILFVLANQVKDAATLIEPWLPHTSEEIFRQLNIKARTWGDLGELSLKSGHQIGEPQRLFRKLEDKEIQELKGKYSGSSTKQEPKFADFDLEVGQIIDVQRHPDAEKLYVEKVKMGDGEIQIVSGLVPYYSPEQLKGKKIVVLRNLMPAKLRGVESQGMLLVAETEGDLVEAFDCENSEVGQKIRADGIESRPKKHISYKEFGKIKLEVKEYQAFAEGAPLYAGIERLKTTKIKDGKIS